MAYSGWDKRLAIAENQLDAGVVSTESLIFAVYLELAARESYRYFPVLSFPALFLLLVTTTVFMYWLFKRRR